MQEDSMTLLTALTHHIVNTAVILKNVKTSDLRQ